MKIVEKTFMQGSIAVNTVPLSRPQTKPLDGWGQRDLYYIIR